MSVLGNLHKVLSMDYKGPRLGFSEVHVIKALLEIEKSKSIGRTKSALCSAWGKARHLPFSDE